MPTTNEKAQVTEIVKQEMLDLFFLKARTHHAWLDRTIDDKILKQAYDLARMGPTSANDNPMRLIFIKSQEAKNRLKPALSPGNIDQTMNAPVTAIIAYDLEFYEYLPRLFPHADAKSWYVGQPEATYATAFRNGTLQAAYFMLACRSLGLDLGPMSGFDNEIVDKEFFAGTAHKSNFLCNIGYGDPSKLHPRGSRLEFKEIAKII
jgi:3-hydroxypropanoate dehydrogenase